MADGRHFLQQALTASEQKQFSQALTYTDQALIAFAQANDMAGFAETYSMRFHAFKHLFSYTNFLGYHNAAVAAAETAVTIATKHHTSNQHVTLINLAKAYDQDDQNEKALTTYDLAIEAIQATHDVPPSILADTQNHKEALLLSQGDTSAEERMLQNIHTIQTDLTVSPYERDVWTSGAYLRLYGALHKHSRDKAQSYLAKAREVIESNPDLVIRKDQMEKLIQPAN